MGPDHEGAEDRPGLDITSFFLASIATSFGGDCWITV